MAFDGIAFGKVPRTGGLHLKAVRASTADRAQTIPPLAASALAWAVPGAGHLLLGRRQKGLVFLVALPAMFLIGLGLSGRLFPFVVGEPLVMLAALATTGHRRPGAASPAGSGPGTASSPLPRTNTATPS